jgi:hypothetical protein
MDDQEAFAIALEEAKLGYDEGGVPVRNPSHSPFFELL